MTTSHIVRRSRFAEGRCLREAATRQASSIYLGEDGGPDGLNLLDLGGTEDGLDLVGLYREIGISYCVTDPGRGWFQDLPSSFPMRHDAQKVSAHLQIPREPNPRKDSERTVISMPSSARMRAA